MVAGTRNIKKGDSEEVKFTQCMSELLSPEMWLSDSMILKIRVSFTVPVMSVFVCLKLGDKEVLAKDTKILETTLFGVGGKAKASYHLIFNISETEYRVYLEISRLDFF